MRFTEQDQLLFNNFNELNEQIPELNYFNRHNSDREYFNEFNQCFEKQNEPEVADYNFLDDECDKKSETKSKILDNLPTYGTPSICNDDEALSRENEKFLQKDGLIHKTQGDNESFSNLNLELSEQIPFLATEPVKTQQPLFIQNKPEIDAPAKDEVDDDIDISSVKAITGEVDGNTKDASTISASKPKLARKSGTRKTKTTEFAYLLERKAFRMMRKYYKEKFEFTVEDPDYKKNLPSMTAEELNTLVCKFMEKELHSFCSLLTEKDYERTRDALKTIVLCDRYRKKERISEGLDFTPLRNVLHKYNTRNLIELLSDASYSFLFTHFFLMHGQKSSEEQEDVDREKLIQRMRHLMNEASNYLPSEINALFEDIYQSIYN